MLFPVADIIFYAFALLLIASAFMVILSRHPVQSALYLVLAFFASAGLWIMTQAEFLGLILILVYVGAVMTLFLFVVMTVPMETLPPHQAYFRSFVLGFFVLLLFVFLMGRLLLHYADVTIPSLTLSSSVGDTQAIGQVLYTIYLYPFELGALLLLLAIVAAISLNAKIDRRKIINDINAQINTQASDRLKIIRMQSEKKIQESSPHDT